MKIIIHRHFKKEYSKLAKNDKERVKERIGLFLKDQFHPILNNHPLRGKYKGYRSIGIGGDLRAIYKLINPDIAVFVVMGTHSKLYF